MISYSKFAYGSQLPGEKKEIKIWLPRQKAKTESHFFGAPCITYTIFVLCIRQAYYIIVNIKDNYQRRPKIESLVQKLVEFGVKFSQKRLGSQNWLQKILADTKIICILLKFDIAFQMGSKTHFEFNKTRKCSLDHFCHNCYCLCKINRIPENSLKFW